MRRTRQSENTGSVSDLRKAVLDKIEDLESSCDESEKESITSSYEYEDDIDDSYKMWEPVARKSVMDSDGFYTDYVLYKYLGDPSEIDGVSYICMFGDSDIYTPDPDYADMVFESEDHAWEWFDSYNGFDDEEDPVYL